MRANKICEELQNVDNYAANMIVDGDIFDVIHELIGVLHSYFGQCLCDDFMANREHTGPHHKIGCPMFDKEYQTSDS